MNVLICCFKFFSIEPMWPVSKDVQLREDVQVLIKFWQAMHSDKKYMKYFMVSSPVDAAGQLMPHTSSSSQYTSGSSGLGPYLQVSWGRASYEHTIYGPYCKYIGPYPQAPFGALTRSRVGPYLQVQVHFRSLSTTAFKCVILRYNVRR